MTAKRLSYIRYYDIEVVQKPVGGRINCNRHSFFNFRHLLRLAVDIDYRNVSGLFSELQIPPRFTTVRRQPGKIYDDSIGIGLHHPLYAARAVFVLILDIPTCRNQILSKVYCLRLIPME